RGTGPNLSRKARMSIRPRKFADVLWLGRTVALAQKPSSKTQFCGRAHKLLPKVSFRVVLSAPKKRPAATIATSTSKYTMRTALLLRQTRMHFKRLDVDQIKLRLFEKGGSDRKFYRIHCRADPAAAGLIRWK